MVRYSGFDASDNATIGDFIASLIFRLCISLVAVLCIVFIPSNDIKFILTLFYLIYISFNIVPIAKSMKAIFWDAFIEDDKQTLSNICYYRMTFQILETVINYVAIYLLYTHVLLK
jgi:hypothetical protein